MIDRQSYKFVFVDLLCGCKVRPVALESSERHLIAILRLCNILLMNIWYNAV